MDWLDEKLEYLLKKNKSLRPTLFLYLFVSILICGVASLVTVAVIVNWERLLLDDGSSFTRYLDFLQWRPATTDFLTEQLARQINLLEIIRNIAPFIFGFVAVMFITERFYQQKIKQPLNLLQGNIRKMQAGDYSEPVTVYTNDDFADLASQVDALRKNLGEQQEEIQQLHLEQKKINGAFSHDLRTPLSVIQNNGELLEEILPSGNLLVENALEKIQRNVIRLTHFSQTMQEIQRLEEIPVAKRPVTSTVFTNQIIDVLEAFPAVTFTSKLPKIIGMNLDISLVMEAFENVLNNATRYSVEQVEVEISYDNGYLIIIVKDDGPGFSRKALQSAVEPYYSQNKESHFGLGLTIVDVLTRKHGGVLKIGNGVRGGAIVTLVFTC